MFSLHRLIGPPWQSNNSTDARELVPAGVLAPSSRKLGLFDKIGNSCSASRMRITHFASTIAKIHRMPALSLPVVPIKLFVQPAPIWCPLSIAKDAV
jgi:hypothetical protein